MSFAEAWAAASDVDGWLTEVQARRLFAAAAAVPATGRIVEIGSFRGRSAIVLARGARPGVEVVCVDPHAGSDRGPQEIGAEAGRGNADFDAFHANLAAAGVAGRVRHVRRFSADAHDDVPGDVALLYVDGAHRFGPARADLAGWGRRVAPGGTMLVHDAFSSVGVTLALLAECVVRGGWRYAGRTGSLAEYERVSLRGPARVRNAGQQLAQLPWFARNVLIKALVLAGLRPLAHRLGLPAGMHWPY
jgi:SAM-dependent methyltransferase